MPQAALRRRGVLLGGAVLALPGFLSSVDAAGLPPASADRPLVGSVVGWVTVESDRATLRLAQIGDGTAEARLFAVRFWPFDPAKTSVHGVCQQAQALTVDAVARSWGLSGAECVVACGRIAHPGQGRDLAYAVWADMV